MRFGGDRKRAILKLCLLPLMGWVVLAAAGYIPTRRLAGTEGVQAMLAAQCLVAVVVFATMLSAMQRMVGKSPVDGFRIAMLAGFVRFLVALFLLGGIAWLARVPVAAFLVWGAITYAAMVMLEAVAFSRWTRYLESERRC